MAQNPFRSEADAYRFLLLTIGYFALIVAATFVHRWLGFAAFVALTAVAVWRWAKWRSDEPREREVVVPRDVGEGERRILVVANETVGGEALLDVLRERSTDVREDVLVVVPALNTPLRHWVSDDDGARAAAQSRLEASLARLRQEGIRARGEIGDGDPLQAMEDALRIFGAHEIVISTHPEGRSNWLERSIVEHARERFDAPITHVVVDLEREAQ